MFVGPKICRCAPILLNLYLMAVNHEQAARASSSWEAGDGSLGGRYGFVRKRGYLQVPRLRAKNDQPLESCIPYFGQTDNLTGIA